MRAGVYDMEEDKINILVVDDDVHVLKTLKAIITEFGMVPLLAENVPEALKLLQKQSIELILTDLIMPEIDGLEFLDIVKREYPSIPIAVLSAYGIIANTVSALTKGAYSFITKPFSLEDIKAVIDKGLRLRNLSLNTDALQGFIHSSTNIEFPGDADLFPALLYFIIKECQWRGVEKDTILTNVAICLEELLYNAFFHGNKKDKSKIIKVKADFNPGLFQISIKDSGRGFNHQAIMEQLDSSNPLTMKKKGLFIVKNMVDTVAFNNEGNEVIITFAY